MYYNVNAALQPSKNLSHCPTASAVRTVAPNEQDR